LRRALLQAVDIKKIVVLTLCLVRLHKFCIDNQAIDKRDRPLAAPLPADADESLLKVGLAATAMELTRYLTVVTTTTILHGHTATALLGIPSLIHKKFHLLIDYLKNG
jgi:hypothetical protein